MAWRRVGDLLNVADDIGGVTHVLPVILVTIPLPVTSLPLIISPHLKDDIVEYEDPGVAPDHVLVAQFLDPLVSWRGVGLRLAAQADPGAHLARHGATRGQGHDVGRV